jgi:hypothetical protein
MRLVTGRRTLLAVAALSTLALGACVGDGDELITDVGPTAGPLFDRYVSLGNSITAGFQSGGIVDSLQLRAYPVVLAARAGADFGVPLLARPGCPAPFTGVLTPPTGTPPCALRSTTTLPPVVQNLAVPGVRINDLFAIPQGQLAQLYTLITGGRPQAQAMIDRNPTFVSAWIGNNDALGAALSGVLGPLAAGADSNLTRLSVFQQGVNALAAAINESTAQGALIVGVVDPVVAVPLLQPGAYFFLARDPATGRFQGKPVNANCSPVTALGQPNPLARNFVSFQVVSSALPEINCDPAAQNGAFLLDQAEATVVRTRIAQYNAALQAIATANSWAYVDPNTLFAQLAAQTTNVTISGTPVALYQNVRKCQLLATAATPAQFQDAVTRSCPVTGATAAPGFFGSLFSLDGVHPSTSAHRVIAGNFAAAINTRYGTSLSTATN